MEKMDFFSILASQNKSPLWLLFPLGTGRDQRRDSELVLNDLSSLDRRAESGATSGTPWFGLELSQHWLSCLGLARDGWESGALGETQVEAFI